MSFVFEFLPEASADVECVTSQYEARVAGLSKGSLMVWFGLRVEIEPNYG